MKKSLIFFLPHFIIGGAGNSIKNIALLLSRQKVKITIISLGKNHYRSELLKNKIKIIELSIKRTLFAIFYIKTILRKESQKFCTYFISNINYANVLTSIFLTNINNIRIILIERTPVQELFFHNSLLEFLKKKFIYYLAANFYKKANIVVGNSKKLSEDWSKIINRTVKTIYPITEISEPKKTISNKIRLTWIGRNSTEKNISDFINCLKYLDLSKYKINIITDKIDKKKINIKILQAVKFYSFVNDKKEIENYYKNTDILVSTSFYEGFPNVVAEAINYNCLIITSKNYGGIYDLIKNKNYGIFYEIGNAKELAKKINSIKLFSKSTLKKIKLSKLNLKSIAKKHNKDFESLFVNKELI